MKNLLQVCISVYNKTEESLSKAIESIPDFAQVRIDFDGGWNYSDMMDHITKKYPEIDVKHYTQNQGLAVIRNNQIETCPTKYIMFLDADDQLVMDQPVYNSMDTTSKFVEKILDIAEPNLVIAPVILNTEKKQFIEYRNINVRLGNGQTLFVLPSLIFNVRYLVDHGLYFVENGLRYEDVIPSIKLTQLMNDCNWEDVCIVYSPLYQYNLDIEDSLSKPIDESKVIESTLEVIRMIKNLHVDKKMAYIRATEEALRLFSLEDKLPQNDREELINLLKPYKFF